MNKKKVFGRYHDIVLLLIGSFLTIVVGGFLSYFWQQQANNFAREAEHRRSEQEAATRVFEELSRLMDRRLYRMRRIHTGLEDPNRDSKNLTPRWDAYRESLFEWNENLNRILALTQRYFGNNARYVLEHKINSGFRQLGWLLEGQTYPEDISSQFEYRQQIADQLNNLIYNFDVQLIAAIQSGFVGKFHHELVPTQEDKSKE